MSKYLLILTLLFSLPSYSQIYYGKYKSNTKIPNEVSLNEIKPTGTKSVVIKKTVSNGYYQLWVDNEYFINLINLEAKSLMQVFWGKYDNAYKRKHLLKYIKDHGALACYKSDTKTYLWDTNNTRWWSKQQGYDDIEYPEVFDLLTQEDINHPCFGIYKPDFSFDEDSWWICDLCPREVDEITLDEPNNNGLVRMTLIELEGNPISINLTAKESTELKMQIFGEFGIDKKRNWLNEFLSKTGLWSDRKRWKSISNQTNSNTSISQKVSDTKDDEQYPLIFRIFPQFFDDTMKKAWRSLPKETKENIINVCRNAGRASTAKTQFESLSSAQQAVIHEASNAR